LDHVLVFRLPGSVQPRIQKIRAPLLWTEHYACNEGPAGRKAQVRWVQPNSLRLEGCVAIHLELAELDVARVRDLRRVVRAGHDVASPLEHVWFEYTPGQPVLREVSFRAAPGTTTALVGSSGSGKSTLISLVMAFNRPTNGHVLVDGRDLAQVRLLDYREQLASVLQDNFLFDGTIADNVGYAKPGASLDEIKEACRIAHCDEFIERFPRKYDTIVGERGIKLSGGQRQRVSIARAILANPRILILDEATSSLDNESELLVQDALDRLMKGRTTFVIAHRLSTIQKADRIVVLDKGKLVEEGTHATLLDRKGLYYYLYTLRLVETT